MKLEKFTTSFGKCCAKLAMTFFLLMTGVSVHLHAQMSCPLSCIGKVNVSLDENCEVLITPQMILSDDLSTFCATNYRVLLLDKNDKPLPGAQMDGSFLVGSDIYFAYKGMNIKVKVELVGSNNSCWGYIMVEDKIPPVIECPEVPDTVDCDFMGVFLPPPAFDNCDGPIVPHVLSDVFEDLPCSNEFSAILTIRYQAKDIWGNKSEICERVILFRRIDAHEIIFPRNYDGLTDTTELLTCNGAFDNPLLMEEGWDKNGNYYPDPEETGVPLTPGGKPLYPKNETFCEINVIYKDHVLDICPGSFKVLRTWLVLDWCTGKVKEHIQIIKVLDEDPPIVAAPQSVYTLFADPWTCTADFKVPDPIVIFECTDSITYTVKYKVGNAIGTLPGVNADEKFTTENVVVQKDSKGNFLCYVIRDIPLGRTWVVYTIKDPCGNTTELAIEVDVYDKTPPTPVCIEKTVVALNSTGKAKVFAHTFNNGSHDKCTDVGGFLVRRKDAGCTIANNEFREYVEFCCEDVGKTIRVEMLVYDDANLSGIFGDVITVRRVEGFPESDTLIADNYSTCWVDIFVQNKTIPKITCPPDIEVHCTTDLDDLEILGEATGLGICGPIEATYVDVGQLDECFHGTITRIWTVVDGELSNSCVQIIKVSRDSLRKSDIIWPFDVTRNECGTNDLLPENLPENAAYPRFPHLDCGLVGISYEDQVFTVVDDVCFKIIRTWTVIDWCLYDKSQRTKGKYSHAQIIKVNDITAPVIANTSNVTVCTYRNTCDGYIELFNTAEDCTPLKDQKWSYVIDPFNDGEGPFITGNTNNASGVYPVGTHRITWKVYDRCGNSSTATYLFTIDDCKHPTPYCISELTTVIMPSTGSVEIWAIDFDRESFDNCTEHLVFTFNNMFPVASLIGEEHFFKGNGVVATEAEYEAGIAQKWKPAAYSSAILLTCTHVGPLGLQMWVRDEAGNADFCNVILNVQANEGCDGEASARVSGQLRSWNGQAVEQAMVSLESINTGRMSYYETKKDGTFLFNEMPSKQDYEIRAEKNNDVVNGVSTLDIVMIQRHILGIQPFNDPYKVIAADVNNSQSVTSTDIAQLRKVILGIYKEFPENQSWKFIDATQVFYDVDRPWDYAESIIVNEVEGHLANNNFTGIKIGDVSGDAVSQLDNRNIQTRSLARVSFKTLEQHYKAGDYVVIPFTMESLSEMIGFQMTLGFDSRELAYEGIESKSMAITEDFLGLTQVNEGLISVSWNDVRAFSIEPGEILFTISFKASSSGKLSKHLNINSTITQAEAYNANLDVFDVNLIFDGETDAMAELRQNRPNPFKDQTVISFVLPEESQASLTIFDVTGRMVYRLNSRFNAGLNNVEIRSDDIPVEGVLYYQLESNGFKETRRMIKINK